MSKDWYFNFIAAVLLMPSTLCFAAEVVADEPLPAEGKVPEIKNIDAERPYIGTYFSDWGGGRGQLKLVGVQFNLTQDYVGAVENAETTNTGATNQSQSNTSLIGKRRLEYSLPERFFDIRTAFKFGNTSAELSFLRYRGFSVDQYLINDVDQEVPNTALSKLTLSQTALHVNYAFRGEKYSQRAPYDLAEQQLRTAHSPILRLTIEKFSLRNREGESIVPDDLQNDFGAFGVMEEIAGWSESLAFGYAVTVIPVPRVPALAPIFINGGINVGAAISQVELQLAEERKQKDLNGATMELNFAMGYNAKALFSALTYQAHYSTTAISELTVGVTNYFLGISLGSRF